MKKAVIIGILALVCGLGFTLIHRYSEHSRDAALTGIGIAEKPEAETIPAVASPDKVNVAKNEPLGNFDLRLENQKNLLPVKARLQALEQLKGQVSDLTVDFDSVTKSPKWIGSSTHLLTGPQVALAAQDANAPIRQFIASHRAVFGHGPEVLDSARLVTDYRTSRSTSRKVVWHQQLDGIDIFEAVFQANLTADSALINIGSQMMPEPAKALEVARRNGLISDPPVSVEVAVAAAGANVGEKIQASGVRPMGPPAEQPDKKQLFRAAMLTDAEAKLTWVPMDESTLRLAWDVTLTSRSRAEMYRVLVDVENGTVLVRQALTAYISPVTYRVFTSESPTPFSPGHESPSSLQPPLVDRVELTTSALDTTASQNGWINDGDNITSGNNTDTYTDIDNNNSPDLPRTTGSPNRVFDFPLDLTQEPSTYKDASNTQLFYWTNFMHDRMYQLGFTEAAGNFQIDNFGRGGIGNDPVNAEAQDGSGTNNANFSTPVDGGRGRMQMFAWTSPTPDRDGSFEAEVVLHEYGHGVSNRLVGGPSVGMSNLSSRGMGEGWSDFYGMALTAEATDNPHGNWARAGYSRYFTGSWYSENYYFGARRYSYSTDMQKNPHTLRDIDPSQVDWHTDVPRNPTYAATQDASQVHYQGTVWCVMLWDLRANLILKHGFNVGSERALFLVTEGMKFSAANPNFVQSRDGIIQATMVNHPEDLGEVWTAFAKRGMGYGATAPVSSTTTGITESYSVPDGLELSDRSGWNIQGSKGGDFSPNSKTLTLSNDGATTLNWMANPNASWLSISPSSGSLAVGATVIVTVTSQASEMESGFYSTNIVFSNTTTGFNQPVGVRLYVTPPVAQTFDLSSNPGWTMEGQWAYGIPTGSGGLSSGGSGNADPSSGATGSSVLGVNLIGNVSSALGGPYYLTSAPLDLSALKNTRLRFMRWLNTGALANTRVTVEITADGVNWREVFVNPGSATTDDEWKLMDYDISSIADKKEAVQVRWGYQNVSSPGSYSGWNIDDVQLLGESTAQFSLAFETPVSEGAGSITGTLNLSLPQDKAVVVSLTSSDVSAATVPAAITLNPQELNKTFTITLINDGNLDGSQSSLISTSSVGFSTGKSMLVVEDDETAVLTLTMAATATEGAEGLTGSVSVSAAPTRDVVVKMNSDSAALMLPDTVTIPAGTMGPVNFTYSAPDNAYAEGPKTANVTASVANWTSGLANIQVSDDDVATILVTGPVNLREGDVSQDYTVTVNTIQSADLILSLTSDDLSELTVPASVTISVGQFTSNFSASITDDVDQDGTQIATITVSGSGLTSGIRTINIADNDVASYTFANIASPQKRSKPIAIFLTARDINGDIITNHTGSVNLTAASPTTPPIFAPNRISEFSNGVAYENLFFTTSATAVTITAMDSGGQTGISNAFDIEPVMHDSFVWSGLPTGSVSPDTLFNATATAVDDLGAAYTGYHDITTADIWRPVSERTVGTDTTTTTKIYNTASHDSRSQMLYRVEDLGNTPRWIGGIGFTVGTAGGQSMSNATIRLKHTDREDFTLAAWEGSGWQTVYTSAGLSSGTSLIYFTQPFYYNGEQNVILDFSFNGSTASTAGSLRFTASANSVLSGASNSAHGDPLLWGISAAPTPELNDERPNIRFYEARNFGQIPASPMPFSNGAWSGQASVPGTIYFSSFWLRALAPSGVQGFSNRLVFSTGGLSSPVGADTVFSEGFESGTLGSAWNTSNNSGASARTQVTTANTPKTGSYHLTLDTTSTSAGVYARNSPTLTLDLAGRHNVSVEWFAKEFADENHIPTLAGPLGTFDSNMNFDGVAISQDGVTWAEIAPLLSLSSSYGSTPSRVALDPIIQRLGWNYDSDFYIRFSQYDDQAIPSDGIALDDIVVRADPVTAIQLSLPATIPEGSSSLPITVTLPSVAVSNTLVNLSSNAPLRLSIPSSVMVLAGQTTASTTISAPQNQDTDVGRDVVITATTSGYPTGYHHIRVVDDEQPILTVTLPASVTEGGSSAMGTVTITPLQVMITPVYLTLDNNEEATVTSSVSIGPGNSSASFLISPINDTRLDGEQIVTVTASGQGLVSGSSTMSVLDNESTQLSVTPPPTLREGGPMGVGTVRLSGPRSVPTTIQLTSSDMSEATVTPSIVIPAGQTSANFQAIPVDDALQDGVQTVSVNAESEGFINGTANFIIRDNDPNSFSFSIIASPQIRNRDLLVTITALDENSQTFTDFNGKVTLSATVALTSAAEIFFTNGVWTGQVRLGAAGTDVTLTATGGDGATGISDPFDVSLGSDAAALAFTSVPSPYSAGQPIRAQVRAVDAAGYLVNEISGPVTVDLVTVPEGNVLATFDLTLVNGEAAHNFIIPVPLAAVRLQGHTPTLLGQGNVFTIVSPEPLIKLPPEVIFTDGFESGDLLSDWTITGTGPYRTRVTNVNTPNAGSYHLTMDSSADGVNARNEATLTLNLAGKRDVELTFWMKEFGDEDHGPPTSPFTNGADFDGVAISADGITWYEVQGLRTTDGVSSLYKKFTVDLSGTAALHGLTFNENFKIRFNQFDNYTISTDGFAFDDVSVVANANAPLVLLATIFQDDFEIGLFKSEWKITGTGNHRTEITSAQDPINNFHLLMDCYASGNSRNEATLTLDLTGYQNLTLDFRMKENSDEDQAPPSNPFTGGADFDGVAISVDGTTWYEVQALRGSAVSNEYKNFTVDLSAAITTWGLSLGADFKIRFNHFDNSPWVSGDGFAFDNIRISGRPLQQLLLSMPTVISEGGSASAHVEVPVPQSVDTFVRLTCNRPASLSLPSFVIVPAGSTVSPDFTISAFDDTVLTGDLEVQILAVAEGYHQGEGSLNILDNETPVGFHLALSTSLAEGTSITGTISITDTSLLDLEVTLSATPALGLSLPSVVTIPKGASSVGFALAKPENDIILEETSSIISASLGSASDSVAVALTDNDSVVPMAITLPLTVLESSTSAMGSVGFASPISTGRDIVINLSSSNAGILNVPATVTLPAGSGSVSFSLQPQDNALHDGGRPVTITASATGLVGASQGITVQDDDLHHFQVDAIDSPQVVSRPFDVTLRAVTIDNQTVAAFTGAVSLSAASGGTPVPMSPNVTEAFVNGELTTTLNFPNVGSDIILSVHAEGGSSGSSNAFNISSGPRLAISPASIDKVSPEGDEPVITNLTLSNPGSPETQWTAEIINDSFEAEPTLSDVLVGINADYASITALIPNRYDFIDGVAGNYITDGGGDMYDNGNYLGTNITSSGTYLNYSDNQIIPSANLGAGGQYFTRKQPGLFVFAGDVAGLNYFEITGNLGADGSGATNTAIFTSSRGSRTYKGFVKRVYGTGDSSVNHLIIVQDNGSATQVASTNTDNDYHRLTDLAGVTRVYYLLFASTSGGYINDSQMQAIMEKFLDSVTGNQWLSIFSDSGTIVADGTSQLTAKMDPRGLSQRTHSATLRFTSNDPISPQQDIPVNFTILPGVDHLEWSLIPSPQSASVPFAATVTAKAADGQPVTAFNGSADLTAFGPLTETLSGLGSVLSSYPLNGSYYENRVQAIYTPAEVGIAGRIQSIAFNVATIPGVLKNFKVRLKHTTKTDYSSSGSALWENTGWTTVSSGILTVPATGWFTLPLSVPFDYDGSSPLMVDFSFDNVGSVSTGSLRCSSVLQSRTLYAGTYSDATLPEMWSGTLPNPNSSNSLPNLKFSKRDPLPVNPQSIEFTQGVWSGNALVGAGPGQVSLTATHTFKASVKGETNAFDVSSVGTLSLSMPNNGLEGSSLNATVTANAAPASDLVVSLSTDDPSEATLPTSVTILAGQTSASFTITLEEDVDLDGSQLATITAMSAGYDLAAATVSVQDNETTSVTLTLPSTIIEGATGVTTRAIVRITRVADSDLTIKLDSSLPTRLTAPSFVIIPKGQSKIEFNLVAPNNNFIEDIESAVLTATLVNSTPATAVLQVLDNESHTMNIYLYSSSLSEGSASVVTGGYVYTSNPVANPLTVNLTSSDTSELIISTTVTIPAGNSQSGTFTFTPVDDTDFDGSQTVTITATANTFSSTSRNITILDDDVHHFTVSNVASPQIRNAPFNVSFTAKDINNVTITSYANSPTLTAVDGSNPLSISPSTLTGFSNGFKTQSVTVQDFATSAVMTVTDATAGSAGSSNTFAVGSGSLAKFAFDPIPSPQKVGAPISTTVTAQDSVGNTVTSFNGTAALSIYSEVQVGSAASTWNYPLYTSSHDPRIQTIYTASELGAAKAITSLQLNVLTLPSLVMNAFTIRLKHTSKSDYTSGGVGWDNTGWTTCYQSNTTISSTGWFQFNFTTPFVYDGTQNVMVDICFNNSSSSSSGYVFATTGTSLRTIYYASNSGYGNPLTWGDLTPPPYSTAVRPDIRLNYQPTLIPFPTTTGSFTNGVWTGDVTFAEAASDIRLQASNGGFSGESNVFSVMKPTLAISLPTSAVESSGSVTGSISILEIQGADLTINLSSNKMTEALLASASVVIPAGALSVPFTLNVSDDTEADGDQMVTITALASGLDVSITGILIVDDDPHHYAFSPVSLPTKDSPFNVTILAQNAGNQTMTSFNGSVSLSAKAGAESLPIDPTETGAFLNGVWTGLITIKQEANDVVLTATDAYGRTGNSSSFNVSAAPVARFIWEDQPSSVVAGSPFAVTLSTVDAAGDHTPYNGSAQLSVVNPVSTTTTIGAGVFENTTPLYANQADCRGQIIYNRSEVGPARRLTALALNISGTSAFVYNNFVIRLKHTTKSNFNTGASWESTGWTEVWRGTQTFNSVGWVVFTFIHPFDYNGSDNLMVDVSTDNITTGSSARLRRDPTDYDVGMIYFYSQTSGDPLTWSGSNVIRYSATDRPQIRFYNEGGINVSPAITGSFVNGSWSGNITVSNAYPALVLQADNGSGVIGKSLPLNVGYPAPVMDPEPVYTGGLTNYLSWSSPAASSAFIVEQDETLDFTSPTASPLTTTTSLATGLLDGNTYHYRVRVNEQAPSTMGEWQQTSYADFSSDTHSGTSVDVRLHEITLSPSSTTDVIWTEDFDQSGSSWSATLFSDHGGTISRDRVVLSSGPNASPVLPINQGGDKVGRADTGGSSKSGYAYMTEAFTDGSIETYLAATGVTGYIYAGPMLRSGPTALTGTRGYLALADFNQTSVAFSIRALVNGINYSLSSMSRFSYSTGDNFKVRFSALGNTLTLEVWRVSVISGVVTETPLLLSGDYVLAVTSEIYPSGRPGLYFSGTSGEGLFDDVKVVKKAPVYQSSGQVLSPIISPVYVQKWAQLEHTLDLSDARTSATVDVLDAVGNLLVPAVPSGTDLSSLPQVASQSSIRLRGNLNTTNSAVTPRLLDWRVGYVLNPSMLLSSAWSAPVSSTQDATPPLVSVSTPEFTTPRTTASLTGNASDNASGVGSVTAAGVGSVTAAGFQATSSDAFANWRASLTNLTEGSNSISITVNDKAVPPNSTTIVTTIFSVVHPASDPDGNGISTLMEHAFGISSETADPHSLLPTTMVQTDAETGESFLIMEYRRRLARIGLTYAVETSEDLTSWDDTEVNVIEQSVVPTGDGVTETVRVRVTPSMDFTDRKFIRLKVTVN